MAAADFHHGVRVTEVLEGTRYIRTIQTGIIGLIATATDADEQTFPLNVPVLITNVRSKLGKAGTQGTLYKSLKAIANQTSPFVVVVRVEEGATPEETTSNVIGTVTEAQQYTGMQGLLAAQSLLGVTPRVLGAPGLDNKEVITALLPIAKKLRAFVYAKCQGETVSEMINYRKDFAARELMLIAGDFLSWDNTTDSTQPDYAVAYALGLRAMIDDQIGWNKTISNVAINGPTGIDMDLGWSLQSSDTDVGLLNANEITALINYNGFRFWGNRTCSDDSMFAFESATRTSQIIADTIAEAHFPYVDKVMTIANARDIVESTKARIRLWVTGGYLLGGNCWYDPELNQEESLKNGQIAFDYDFTDTPPMEDIQFNQRKTDRYFADFSQSLAQA